MMTVEAGSIEVGNVILVSRRRTTVLLNVLGWTYPGCALPALTIEVNIVLFKWGL